jgi:type IV fimbrial biogenesis protein FimT
VLNLQNSQRGVSMIELLIGLVIVGVLAVIAAPALSSWIQNAQIRTTAEAIQNGLQLARGEAVHLNTLMRFQLMSSTDNTCQPSTNNSNWVVSQGDPTGACASAPSSVTNFVGDPLIVQVRPSAEGSGSAVDAAGQSLICFNGLGKQATNAACNPPGTVTISVTNPNGGACLAAGGPMKCLNVVVSSAGQIRMCDPSLSQAANPAGC